MIQIRCTLLPLNTAKRPWTQRQSPLAKDGALDVAAVAWLAVVTAKTKHNAFFRENQDPYGFATVNADVQAAPREPDRASKRLQWGNDLADRMDNLQPLLKFSYWRAAQPRHRSCRGRRPSSADWRRDGNAGIILASWVRGIYPPVRSAEPRVGAF
jgi:hypothetical protein